MGFIKDTLFQFISSYFITMKNYYSQVINQNFIQRMTIAISLSIPYYPSWFYISFGIMFLHLQSHINLRVVKLPYAILVLSLLQSI